MTDNFDKSTIRVMLLDDEPFMLKLIGRLLENLGYTALSSHTSGREALVALAGPIGPPDLILLDLNMPEMDGIEFVRHLVEQHYAGSLVLISGEDERMLAAASTLVQAHKIEVLGHLRKPVSPAALAALLAKWTPPAAARSRAAKVAYGADAVRTAIANGELVNYYQPKVAVTDGRVVGVETLVRWRHPVDGLVLPDQFIGIAEAHGLIDDLTRVVLRQALAQTRAWRDAGLTLRVAVNVSMDNLAALSFADFVVAEAVEAGVMPSEIVLEVTESRLMADLRAPLEILTRLRLKRFRLSIDDFGTGHSSLAQLRDIPFDELKIDQGFVHRAWQDETLRAIFYASLGLAGQLNMEAVAEGVEDQDDWDFLRRTRCDLAQGYFIARPMPAADLPGWIETWDARLLEQTPALIVGDPLA
ncbi:MAG: EAL domain-containing response regulator [Sulfuritalea sp.]|jgi:EAL domain-containing protein (putative c-di-GMP-specific phosphodiesterase class I)|nr:EAL domain-containing response regulator [Sulfuritalea sp.]